MANEIPRDTLERTLGVSFCKLLEEYPLYDRCRDKKLHVLLIGNGTCLELLRDKILANGQLLDTDLTVTVVTPTFAADSKKLLEEAAPELYRFVDLPWAGTKTEVEQPWATLDYEAGKMTKQGMERVLAEYGERSYVLISTGDHKRNRRLAGVFPSGKKCVVAYVTEDPAPPEERKNQDGEIETWEMLHVCAEQERDLPCGRKDEYLKKIEPIAYNLHYAYMKGNNPHATSAKIEETFRDPYNYESNIECAIHVRSKLRCCGIDDPYDKLAAEKFAKKLEEPGGDVLLNELALLEHRRWCISKLLQGFRLQTDMSKIYSAPGIGTHSKKDKWHVCLVPYVNDSKKRRLKKEDWDIVDPADIETLEELDELDKQTLRVHLACRRIKEDSQQLCRGLAQELAEYVKEMGVENLHADAVCLCNALEKMQQNSRSAVYAFEQCRTRIRDAVTREDKEEQPAKKIREKLAELNQYADALIEYLSCKDYKQQNVTLVQQIPFALSKWRDAVLVKIMADDENSCVAAAWHLEPNHAVFVDFADSYAELSRIRSRARRIDRFLYNSCNQIRTSYHIFISGELLKLSEQMQGIMDDWGCTIHRVDSGEPYDIRPSFVAVMEELRPDYIDLTGGKAEMVCLAEGYAQNSSVGAFCIRDDRVCNFYGAKRVVKRALHKGLTVQEMFDQSDALMIKRDDEALSGEIMALYKEFWEIAFKHSENWYGFCIRFFAKAYRAMLDQTKAHGRETLTLPRKYLEAQAEALEKAAKSKAEKEKAEKDNAEYWDILDELIDKKLLVREARAIEEKEEILYHIASGDILSALRNSGKVLEYYIYCTARNHGFTDVAMSWMFSHSDAKDAAKNEIDVVCTKGKRSLFISAKNVKMDKFNKDNFLNYVCYEVTVLGDRFGVDARMVLAAPNVPQFEKGRRSEKVRHAMSRGVYLLGRECFESGRLGEVLDNIVRGEKDWCEFLLKDAVGAK